MGPGLGLAALPSPGPPQMVGHWLLVPCLLPPKPMEASSVPGRVRCAACLAGCLCGNPGVLLRD